MTKANVCDSCLDAFHDDGFPEDLDVAFVAAGMGADIGDHDCDARGNDEIECSCSCPKKFVEVE